MAVQRGGGRKGAKVKRPTPVVAQPAPVVPAAPPGVEIIRAITKVLTELIKAATSAVKWPVVAIVAAAICTITYLIPPAERSTAVASFPGAIEKLLGAGLFPWVGWILLIVVVPTFGLFAWAAMKRLRAQGKRLQKYREAEDPDRVSSENPEVLAAAAKRTSRDAGGETQEEDDGSNGPEDGEKQPDE